MEISNLTKKRIQDFLNEGKRFDNREFLDFRKIEIETGVSKNAEGSVRVKLGNTEVTAGVKVDVATPYTDHEDEGTLITTMELLPLSSSRFEPGPPNIEAIEIARIVDRGVRESGFIDFKKLCIKEGEKVYSVLLDIFSLNDDGNLLDASCLAAIIALKTARMPKYDEKNERIEYGEWTNKMLPLTEKMPITITFRKIGKKIIIDPIREEEETSEARLSLALTSRGKNISINACQKGGAAAFSEEEIFRMIDIASEKYKELESKILKHLEEGKRK